MADSIAENYFEKFTGDDAAAVLTALIVQKHLEDNWLDFKSGGIKLEHLDKVWSKALGAMANAGGGVVVFGILAAKEGNPPVDAAHSLELVPDVKAFASRLNEIAHFATDPPISNFRIKPIPKAPGAKDGFVVCLIPEGTVKPYQSLKTPKPFYLRIGDESKEPSLPLLRQLFNPHLTTKTEVNIQFHKDDKRGTIYICIVNVGTTSIPNATISLSSEGEILSTEPLLPSRRKILFYELPNILHPSMNHGLISYFSWPDYVQEEFAVALYQQNQEMKVEQFTYDFMQHRFIKDGRYNMKEIKLAL